MILVDSFVHADLHPGNIFVDIRHSPAQIVILDVGLITALSARDKNNFYELLSAVAARRGEDAARALTKYQPHLSKETVESFVREMTPIINKVTEKPLAEVEVAEIFHSVLRIARKHKVIIESNFTTLVVGTIVLEGLGRQLDPTINFIKEAVPFLKNDPAFVMKYVNTRLSRDIPIDK